MVTIPLSKPVELGGHKHTEIVFKREPNLGDLRECGIDPATILTIGSIIVTGRGGLSTEQLVRMTSRLSGQSENVVEMIAAKDMLAVHDAVIDFFTEDEGGPQTPLTPDGPSS